jgi:transposase
MAKRPTYPPEFRRRVLELVRSGRTINAVAREFEISRQTIMNWLKQDDLDSGQRTDGGLTTDERKELTFLRRENKRLKMEQEILSKAAAWFARETNAIPTKSSDS